MGWGGKRRNAGRRKTTEVIEVPGLSAGLAAELFADAGEAGEGDNPARPSTKERWNRLRDTKDENLSFRVEQYIWDRAEGKPTIFVAQEPDKPPAEVTFGSISTPSADKPGKVGKPN